MTIEKIKKYRELKLELDDINSKIENATVTDVTKGSQKNFPYVPCNRKISGIPDEDYSLLERKSELKSKIVEIENFVNTIPDYKIRKSVKLYYLEPIDETGNKYTWERIADILNDGSSGLSIKVKVHRFFKKM